MDVGLIATWILLGLVGLAFLMAGVNHGYRFRTESALKGSPWMKDLSPPALRTIGTLEILGGLGLILPFATGILPWLTPLAGVGLVLIMLGAMVFHARRKEPQGIAVNAVLGGLAGAAAWMSYVRL